MATDADAPAPAEDLRLLREDRSVLVRECIRRGQALRLAEAEVKRLRAEAASVKEGARAAE